MDPSKERIVCASTAAGPAFEGARITWGMRASTGAIWKVTHSEDQLSCEVLGSGKPRGICGSGLVDAVACGLELGIIRPDGRYTREFLEWRLCEPVFLAQCDIRELQLAKGAIAAGIEVLLRELGLQAGELGTVYLAGAFGNYVDLDSARRIGLFGDHLERVSPAGNTALLGAKMSLFSQGENGDYASLRKKIQHISLAASPDFQDIFVEHLHFPSSPESLAG